MGMSIAAASRQPRKLRPQDIDLYVSHRVHASRVASGFTQKQLAEFLGLTYQQIFKYEKGTNRIPSATLYRMAELFDVPVASFFEGCRADTGERSKLPDQRVILDLVRNFRGIADGDARELLLATARTLCRLTQERQLVSKAA
jgi:transcriptional regulator with XRE-family HTH domain